MLTRGFASLLLLATLCLAQTATAGVPSPGNSTAPAGIWLVGSKAGVADPAGLFTVVVRDLANAPMVNVPVEIEFEGAPDLILSSAQFHPGVTAFCDARPRVQGFTDGTGTATFIIMGSAAGRYTQTGSIGGQVKIRGAGTVIATVIGAALDQDGANGADGADIAAWLCDFASGQNYARSDLDFNGSIGASDLSAMMVAKAAGNSEVSGPRCDDPGIPSAVFLNGGLSLGWDDCRQLSTGADQSFACNTNTGTTFKLIASLTPRTDLSEVSVVEAVIDIVNPAGTLPDWWRFQTGGCRTTSVSSTDPNNNPSITCSISGVTQVTQLVATYPFNGDPNTERLSITIVLEGGAPVLSADQTALLNLAINRAKTTGVGSCADCNTPVDIVLRSMRVTRGDPCTTAPEARLGDIVFTASTGVNVAHWQSTTPTFPISINATQLSNPNFRLSVGPCVDGSVIQDFTVAPGTYYLIGCPVGQFEFQVDDNGLIQYNPAFEGLMTGAGTTTLTVDEATITVDASTAPAGTYTVDGGPCFNSANIQQLILFPGDYSIGICSGPCPALAAEELLFTVDGAGNVQYEPALEGALNGAGTSTLVLKSFTFPSTRGDDIAPSGGMFRIVVEPEFWDLMAGYPGYAVINGLHRLVSPFLYDPSTRIGRSAIHQDGDAADLAGVPVGTAGTIVSDTHMPVVPPGFAGPAGTAEVHTEIRSMNMTAGPLAVRAGSFAPSRPISAGEIEANPGNSGLFPAESFFNVFVEVDLPVLGTLYNSDALLVENYGIMCFPPEVVYMHKHTGPVPILFKVADTQNPQRWQAGQRFGWLVLAGHGMNMDIVPGPASGRTSAQTTADPIAEFLALVNGEPEMADQKTLVVDVNDVVTHANANAFAQVAYRDSIRNGIDEAAALGEAGNPCAGLFVATRIHQFVDSLPSPSDWVTNHGVRRVLAARILELRLQLLAQANQSGGCLGTTTTPPKVAPSALALLGIQPNPSYGRSTIRYAVPKAERVSLMVFDLSGRHVRTLVDGELPAGTYEAVWDGRQDRASGRAAPSGAYFIRLSAGGKLVTQRLMLVR